ncbi:MULTISPECIES: glycerophosphoryl diester phosphodiesterase membrane domain-containing protein [Microbacterium]|uniref:Glycerophosphoryl diester phosphodiesterase membrane domain-containing protein n=1 Tax=Microbacterium mcarthurae TaxID=3035918 RepID=A0ABW9GKF2_9MICO|nr:glycerophosphoryl diester phosphodiesterase membrane domain-containing protein [Microbacterium sp. ACRRU]MCG7417662.1 glycerophosphoryl diester phosphodiesterase membrane domain-containing protein [Microbacterium sp. ACRRU]
MTAYPAWTPASRAGIVPLHPYGFGTILGRSFVALRHNPRVLLGFALIVQTLAYLIVSAALAGVAIASFARLDTLVEGTDEFDAVMTGSIALTAVAALVLGALAGTLSVLVQGVVVAEVASAVVAEKPTLRDAWRRVRPVFLRLIGYALLTLLAATVVLAVLGGIAVLLGLVLLPLGILTGVLFALGLIPLYLWLATKLFLVPSAMILEGIGIRRAIVRSWVLTRRRFWPTLGVIVIISLAFGAIGQVISLPLGLLSGGISTIVSPTGADDTGALIAFIVVQLIGQVGILLVQCVAVVVQATSAVLVYVDARMRVEGLDHDLAVYVEARDAGASDLPDPYRVGAGRAVDPRAAAMPGSPAAEAAPRAGTWAAPAWPAPSVPPVPAAPPEPTAWTAPGSPPSAS